MLFTDGPFITPEDLNSIDGEFIELARDNGILVDGSSNSLLTRSTLAAGAELTAKIQNFSGYLVGVGVSSNHLAAVLNVLSTAINRPRMFLQQIPVTEPNPTRMAVIEWVRYYCLYHFYQNMFFRNVKEDRFELKMKHYEREKKRRWKELSGNGIPVVLSPFSCPGAVWDYGSGTWSQSNVTSASTLASTAGGVFYVTITWVQLPSYGGPTNPNGNESGGSVPMPSAIGPNEVISVNLSNLNPPTGLMQPAIGTAQGVYPPQVATNWNVYVGNSPTGPFFLQNQAPILITTTTYNLASDPVLSGPIQNPGQPAQYDYSVQNMLWRA